MRPAVVVKPTATAPAVRPRTRSRSVDASAIVQPRQNRGVAPPSLHQLCHAGGGGGGLGDGGGGLQVPSAMQVAGGGLGGLGGLGGRGDGGGGLGGLGSGGLGGGGDGGGTSTSVT